jgi:hypothetical protein
MSNHSASILEILEVQTTEQTSKSGTKYTQHVLPCVIHQDNGTTAVGNVIMRDLPRAPLEAVPVAGRFHPVYEPRPQWNSPELAPALIRLVPAPPVGSARPPVRPAAGAETPQKM